jgi:hypothetical protein
VRSLRDFYDRIFVVTSLQGLANRNGPRLAVRYDAKLDDFWWKHLTEPGAWLANREVGAVTALTDLLEQFRSVYKGASVYDESVPATSHVAAAIVGADDLLIGFATIRTTLAGFYGVVMADLVQGGIVLISCVVVAALAWMNVPDAASLAETARQVTGTGDWTSTLPSWHTNMPSGYGAYEFLMLVAGLYLVRSVIGGLGMGAEPRFFATRNDRECGLQCLLQGVTIAFRWPMPLGFTILGIYLVSTSFPPREKVADISAELHAAYPKATQASWNTVTTGLANTAAKDLPPGLEGSLKSHLGDNWRALPVFLVFGTALFFTWFRRLPKADAH